MLDEFKENMIDNLDSARESFVLKQRRKRPRLVLIIKLGKDFADDMTEDNVGLYAAQSAFFTMLSAVPFLMLVILCLKYFISVDVSALETAVSAAFPAPVSTYVRGIVGEIFARSESTALFSATLVTAVWTSSRGIMSIYMGLNSILGSRRGTNWFAARFASLFYDVLFIAVIVATVVCLVFGNTLLGLANDRFGDIFVAHYVLEAIFKLKYPIFLFLFILAFAALYSFLPQEKPNFRSQLPGAVMTAVGWLGFSYVFSIYIEYFSKYSLLYGSLTAIVFMMLWIFFCIYMLLIGAEVNKHVKSGFFKHARRVITGREYKNLKKQ